MNSWKPFKLVRAQMGRQRNDPIVFQSSIALLQERFKHLQRVKEMREEKELHRVLVEPKLPFNPTVDYDEPSKLFFHFLPPNSSPSSSTTTSQVSSLSLWSNTQSNKLGDHFQYQCMGKIDQAPLLMSFPPAETSTMHGSAYKFDDSKYDVDEVDTSLHL